MTLLRIFRFPGIWCRPDKLIIATCLVAALAWTAQSGGAQSVTLAISCGAVGKEYELCRSGVEAWSRKTGHRVSIVTAPGSTTERLALYQQLLAAGSEDVDIFQIDVIWPGILASYFIDLTPYAKGAEQDHFPAMLSNNRIDGRLIAMPWFSSAGLLYYRRDLLEKYGEGIPNTWADLQGTARRVQDGERASGNPRMWGFVWQGRAYEGLTCNALEWVASHNGGVIIDGQRQVTIDNPRAAVALSRAASWIGAISPPGILNYAEEDARGVFQSGNAVFMRNWPYAWALAQSEDSPVRGRVGVAPLPRGGAEGVHAATLGGWQLAVSRYSRHPDQAADLVMFLTSTAEQKRRALEAAYIPTIPALYRDPEVLRVNPFFGQLHATVVHALPRPSAVAGIHYNRVSSRFWNAVHGVLSGAQPVQPTLKRLHRDLTRILRRGRH